RLQLELARDFTGRYEDIHALDADAVVFTMTCFGTGRDSGGPFENRFCCLFTFGADGHIALSELFEAGHEAEALARFDALGAAANRPLRRRVRPNAATAATAAVEAAFAR